MKRLKWTLLMVVGCILAYGIGQEIANRPRKLKAPPGVTATTFEELSGFELPKAGTIIQPGQIRDGMPESIRALDGQRLLIQGFMVPLRMEDQSVREFLLVRSQMSCCYGVPPQLGEVIEVRMTGPPLSPLMDRIVAVTGRLHIQERWSDSFLGSLYQMDGESVVPASSYISGKPPLGESPGAQNLE